MAVESSILALGSHGTRVWELAERASQLDFRVVRAKTPQEAIDLRAERGFHFGAALIDSEFPATDLAEALQTIRTRLESPDLCFVATSFARDSSSRDRLREAGVELALWDPVGDHTLRFQLNRARASGRDDFMRGELRVPTEWRARVFTAGRQKSAAIYSLSGGGAYLATGQPSMMGAELAVEFPLPEGAVTLECSVLYTNVPGNLRSKKLPNGMAVRFTDSWAPGVRAIRDAVLSTTSTLML